MASFDSLLRADRLQQQGIALLDTVAADNLKDQRHAQKMTVAIVCTVVSTVIMYFVTGILGMKSRYPHLFTWYDAMRAEKVQGAGKHDYSLYQVCTAADFTAAQSMLNMLLVWHDLHFAPANFLMFCISYFGDKAKKEPKAKLTALHWAGSRAQTGYEKLLGEKGWASTGCSTASLGAKKQNLVNNWNAGKDENIWYHLLPQPTDGASTQAFLSVPMIAELYTDSSKGGAATTCDADAFATSKIAQLYDGGLCNVAFVNTESGTSAGDLFNGYFEVDVNPSVSVSCGGAVAAAATQGATSGAMSGMMLLGLVPGMKSVSMAYKGIGMLVASGGFAAANAAASGAAAKERCAEQGGAV